MEHTKGPWTIDRKIDLSHGASVLVRVDGIGIAEVWKTDDRILSFTKDTTAEANARLIAAAPDLLAACEVGLSVVNTKLYFNPDDEIAQEQKKIIEAAIAKAGR